MLVPPVPNPDVDPNRLIFALQTRKEKAKSCKALKHPQGVSLHQHTPQPAREAPRDIKIYEIIKKKNPHHQTPPTLLVAVGSLTFPGRPPCHRCQGSLSGRHLARGNTPPPNLPRHRRAAPLRGAPRPPWRCSPSSTGPNLKSLPAYRPPGGAARMPGRREGAISRGSRFPAGRSGPRPVGERGLLTEARPRRYRPGARDEPQRPPSLTRVAGPLRPAACSDAAQRRRRRQRGGRPRLSAQARRPAGRWRRLRAGQEGREGVRPGPEGERGLGFGGARVGALLEGGRRRVRRCPRVALPRAVRPVPLPRPRPTEQPRLRPGSGLFVHPDTRGY